MKRFHVHIAVENLDASITFYANLFGAQPAITRPDYAKWMLEDPRINFAISARGHKPGVNHLGFQAGDAAELADLGERANRASGTSILNENAAQCCYAKSDKYWVLDPQGLPWEHFHTLGEMPIFGEDSAISHNGDQDNCCVPLYQSKSEANEATAAADASRRHVAYPPAARILLPVRALPDGEERIVEQGRTISPVK